MKEKSLDTFAADLRKTLLEAPDPCEWYHIASLLDLISGIRHVKYDRSHLNTSCGYCSGADIFDEHQYELEKKLVNNLTLFFFCWSFMESLIDVIVPVDFLKHPKGKVNRACFYLKTVYEPRKTSAEYQLELKNLLEHVNSQSYYSNIIAKDPLEIFVGTSGKGLYCVYKLRNELAHGSLVVPVSRQEEEDFGDVKLIKSCIKIIMYTAQMLCHAYLGNQFKTIQWDGEDIDFELHMHNLHLDSCGQLFLPWH